MAVGCRVCVFVAARGWNLSDYAPHGFIEKLSGDGARAGGLTSKGAVDGCFDSISTKIEKYSKWSRSFAGGGMRRRERWRRAASMHAKEPTRPQSGFEDGQRR